MKTQGIINNFRFEFPCCFISGPPKLMDLKTFSLPVSCFNLHDIFLLINVVVYTVYTVD